MVQALSVPCSADEPCPLFLDLADVAEVANRIVVTGNIHTGSETVESVLLISDDGGRTWTEGHARIGAAVLDRIQFLDFEAGWIAGHKLQPEARDPFLLLTTDGGKTWRRKDVFSESRPGIVDQFWFDSRTHGMLVVDRVRAGENGLRYEMWESMTGGESWSVRQVHSEALKIKQPATENLWRIRSDRGTKVHVLEKNIGGGKWQRAAGIAVSAGVCKLEDPPEPAEPPQPPTQGDEPVKQQPSKPVKPPSLKRSGRG
jgi:photosystem II stability/assembly factor-like uncharacterized protein